MKVLIAAGGSGGHIFPAIAVARTLKGKRRDIGVLFVGSNKDLDRRVFEREGFKFSLLSANKLPYGLTPKLAIFLVKLLFDIAKAFFIIVSYRPDVVIGFGGYVSCPVAVISYIFRIPSIAHEQNVVPGRANRVLFRLSDRIAISFNETRRFLGKDDGKAVFTGNPIRNREFSDIAGRLADDETAGRNFGIDRFGLDRSKFTILVIGGSQGSHFLNETFIKALSGLDENLRGRLQVIHITGVYDYEWALEAYSRSGLAYRVHSFIDRIEEAYNASDLVVTRSGSSAIFEIAFFGRPMILVPYPFALSHQRQNAKVFSEKGAAVKIEEGELSERLFKDTISELFNDKGKLKSLAESAKCLSVPEASDNLAEQVLALTRKKACC